MPRYNNDFTNQTRDSEDLWKLPSSSRNPTVLPPPVYRKFVKCKFVGHIGPGKYNRMRQLVIPVAIMDEFRDQGHILMDAMDSLVLVTIQLWDGEDIVDEESESDNG